MKCAFAVTNENSFSEQHFGEADNYLIYSRNYFRKPASKSNCSFRKTHELDGR